MGFAVNKAARVTSAAAGGQAVVSSVVRELVGSHPAYRFGGSFFAELKGIEGSHELVPVEWHVETPASG
jgi:class 3 adenylate cyclase